MNIKLRPGVTDYELFSCYFQDRTSRLVYKSGEVGSEMFFLDVRRDLEIAALSQIHPNQI